MSRRSHALVNAYAQPCESLVDIIFRSGHKALRVGILDTENHLAAIAAGKKVVIESGTDTAYVQRACG